MSLPATAERLKAKALEHGWTCEVLEGQNDHLTLRLRRDGVLMLAFWEKGKWRSGVGFGRLNAKGTSIPLRRLQSREIAQEVAR
jgi:hypothetical protein